MFSYFATMEKQSRRFPFLPRHRPCRWQNSDQNKTGSSAAEFCGRWNQRRCRVVSLCLWGDANSDGHKSLLSGVSMSFYNFHVLVLFLNWKCARVENCWRLCPSLELVSACKWAQCSFVCFRCVHLKTFRVFELHWCLTQLNFWSLTATKLWCCAASLLQTCSCTFCSRPSRLLIPAFVTSVSVINFAKYSCDNMKISTASICGSAIIGVDNLLVDTSRKRFDLLSAVDFDLEQDNQNWNRKRREAVNRFSGRIGGGGIARSNTYSELWNCFTAGNGENKMEHVWCDGTSRGPSGGLDGGDVGSPRCDDQHLACEATRQSRSTSRQVRGRQKWIQLHQSGKSASMFIFRESSCFAVQPLRVQSSASKSTIENETIAASFDSLSVGWMFLKASKTYGEKHSAKQLQIVNLFGSKREMLGFYAVIPASGGWNKRDLCAHGWSPQNNAK